MTPIFGSLCVSGQNPVCLCFPINWYHWSRYCDAVTSKSSLFASRISCYILLWQLSLARCSLQMGGVLVVRHFPRVRWMKPPKPTSDNEGNTLTKIKFFQSNVSIYILNTAQTIFHNNSIYSCACIYHFEKAKYFNDKIVNCAGNQSILFKTIDVLLHRMAVLSLPTHQLYRNQVIASANNLIPKLKWFGRYLTHIFSRT